MSADENSFFADEIIEKLKERFDVWTDGELATKLNIGRSTITSWRRRNSVPDRFTSMLTVGGPLAFSNGMTYEHWSELDKAAMQLGLLRLVRDNAPKLHEFADTLNAAVNLPDELQTNFQAAYDDIKRGLDAGARSPDFALYTMVGYEFFAEK